MNHYSFSVDGKRVIVSHPTAPAPITVEPWTWHAEAFRQLLTERDALRSLLADARDCVVDSLNTAVSDRCRREDRCEYFAELLQRVDAQLVKSS